MLEGKFTAECFRMQIFNQINSRKIKDEYNPFAGLLSSATFLYILLIEVLLQVGIDLHAHDAFTECMAPMYRGMHRRLRKNGVCFLQSRLDCCCQLADAL